MWKRCIVILRGFYSKLKREHMLSIEHHINSIVFKIKVFIRLSDLKHTSKLKIKKITLFHFILFIAQSLTTGDCPHTLNIVFSLILIKIKIKVLIH